MSNLPCVLKSGMARSASLACTDDAASSNTNSEKATSFRRFIVTPPSLFHPFWRRRPGSPDHLTLEPCVCDCVKIGPAGGQVQQLPLITVPRWDIADLPCSTLAALGSRLGRGWRWGVGGHGMAEPILSHLQAWASPGVAVRDIFGLSEEVQAEAGMGLLRGPHQPRDFAQKLYAFEALQPASLAVPASAAPE